MARTPYTPLDHRGDALDTTLAVDASATDLTFTLSAAVGWPDGSSGPFFVTFDPGGTEEKAVVSARSTNVLSIAVLSDRGLDDTAAVPHVAGTVVRHSWSAVEADEANATAVQTLGQITAKGSLLAGTGANALGEVPAGSDGQGVGYDSSAAAGLAPKSFALSSAISGFTSAWTPYTPATSVPATGSVSWSKNAAYLQLGKTIHVRIALALTACTTPTGALTVSLPAAILGGTQQRLNATLLPRTTTVTSAPVPMALDLNDPNFSTTTTVGALVPGTSGTVLNYAMLDLGATTRSIILIQGTYEAA